MLYGIDRAVSGTIKIDGKSINISSPEIAISSGMALVPEDRKQHGLVLDFSILNNIALPGLKRLKRGPGFTNRAAWARDTRKMIDDLGIKTPGPEQLAQFLSGGNQQKVVIGKWLAMKPRLLLLDEPTRGIDVGAKQEIYQLMEELARTGLAILFVSSELDEILGLADRVIVMHEGRISGELARDEMSEQSIMELATGG